MSKWINAEQQVTVTVYDDEHEEHLNKTMTVEEMLDAYTLEGCPPLYLTDVPGTNVVKNKMSNKEWVDFLAEHFNVSRTSAKEMLHGLMRWKAEDNFKKQFSGCRNEVADE